MRKLFFAIIPLLLTTHTLMGQNRYEEIIPFETIDGHIIIKVMISGRDYKFLFDTRAMMSVQGTIEQEIGIDRCPTTVDFIRPEVKVLSAGIAEKIAIGDNIFTDKRPIFVIDNDYLRSIGVSGIVDLGAFANYIVTINGRNRTITVSTPYKPSYMPLKNRVNMLNYNTFDISVAGKTINVTLDLSSNYCLALNDADFTALTGVVRDVNKGVLTTMQSEYKNEEIDVKTGIISDVNIAGVVVNDFQVVNSPLFSSSMLGNELLKYGVLSIDYSGKKAYFQKYENLPELPQVSKVASTELIEGSPIVLTKPLFFSEIFDYRQPGVWKYKGSLPAIVDFWADWCAPCKRMSPILDELAREYKGRVLIYKLNVDEERDIAQYFKIVALPTLMFIPVDGEVVTLSTAQTKENFEMMIKKHLLK